MTESERQGFAGSLSPDYVPLFPADPYVHENCRAYYRRRLKNGNVKVWLRNERATFLLEISADAAAKIRPGQVITLSFGTEAP